MCFFPQEIPNPLFCVLELTSKLNLQGGHHSICFLTTETVCPLCWRFCEYLQKDLYHFSSLLLLQTIKSLSQYAEAGYQNNFTKTNGYNFENFI